MNYMIAEATKLASPSTTRAKVIAKKLRADILNGRLSPGTKLHLDELKNALGVSLSPLREGLSRLAAEGLVKVEDQRGFSVAPVSRRDFHEIIDLRSMLETKALRASIEQGDDVWEADLLATHHILSKLDDKRWKQPYFEQWEEKHRAFHSSLISASNSPLLLNFCQILVDMNHRYRRIFNLKNPPNRDIAREHRALMDAALNRDADKACSLLKEHIDRTARYIVKSMPE
ncbi:MAG TPA: FCD domain-containing protein [Pseudolabrys sp.]|nr:FCD domain-containing protein [Pseudolabrys sp.]